jgi:hypothetical protein
MRTGVLLLGALLLLAANAHAQQRKCTIGNLPSVVFNGRTVVISNDMKKVLEAAGTKLRDNPNCKLAVKGYGDDSKANQQLSWDRVNSVINFLVEKEGISSERFIFRYGQKGNIRFVDLIDATGQEGPSSTPAPHPNLRRLRSGVTRIRPLISAPAVN